MHLVLVPENHYSQDILNEMTPKRYQTLARDFRSNLSHTRELETNAPTIESDESSIDPQLPTCSSSNTQPPNYGHNPRVTGVLESK